MEHAINDAVAEVLCKKIIEQVTASLSSQWSRVVEELASTRKSSMELSKTIESLQAMFSEESGVFNEKMASAILELEKTRENNVKSARILDETLKAMGVEE